MASCSTGVVIGHHCFIICSFSAITQSPRAFIIMKRFSHKKSKTSFFLFFIAIIFVSNTVLAVDLTFDNFVDPGDNSGLVTATKTDGADTYVLSAQHGNNGIVDVSTILGTSFFNNGFVGSLAEDHFTITLKKNGASVNFDLTGIVYDTLATGTIGINRSKSFRSAC